MIYSRPGGSIVARSGLVEVDLGTSLFPRNYHDIKCHVVLYIYFSTKFKIVL